MTLCVALRRMLTYLGAFPHVCTTANPPSLCKHHFAGAWVSTLPDYAWGLLKQTTELAASMPTVQAAGSLKTQAVHASSKRMLSNSGFRDKCTQAIISRGPAAAVHERHWRHSNCLPGEQPAAQPPSASKPQRCRSSSPSCVAYCTEELTLPRAAVQRRGDGQAEADRQIVCYESHPSARCLNDDRLPSRAHVCYCADAAWS